MNAACAYDSTRPLAVHESRRRWMGADA